MNCNPALERCVLDAVAIGRLGANLRGADEQATLNSIIRTVLTTVLTPKVYIGVAE